MPTRMDTTTAITTTAITTTAIMPLLQRPRATPTQAAGTVITTATTMAIPNTKAAPSSLRLR